jgi:hypothetical protein
MRDSKLKRMGSLHHRKVPSGLVLFLDKQTNNMESRSIIHLHRHQATAVITKEHNNYHFILNAQLLWPAALP